MYGLVDDPLADLQEARLERLARVARRLLGGRPIHHGGPLPHPRAANGGLEFMEHRQLLPGDDPRHVDWRASARHRTPLVRRFRDDRSGEWFLCLDLSASMGEAAPGVWPLAVQLAAALAYVLLSLEHRVGLALFSTGLDRVVPPGRGRPTYLNLRRVLAESRPRTSGGDSRLEACLPLLERGRAAAAIGDFLRPDAMDGALARIAARCRSVHVLQVQGEEPTLDSGGPLCLEDSESGERLDTLATPALATGAAGARQALAQRLASQCRRHRILYSASPVGTPWDRTLLAHLVGPEADLA